MFDERLLTEAHALMTVRALKSVPAIDAVADPVARLWCRSFGVADDEAVRRLKGLLAETAIDVISAGGNLDELQDRLDVASDQLIRVWFGRVFGRDVGSSTQALSIVRLAFLDANSDGRWSRYFLDNDAPLTELACELEAVMIEPTPVARPLRMVRQEI